MVREMSEAEAAWLAGFFDGEGTLVKYLTTNGKTDKKYVGYALMVWNTNMPALEKCLVITGTGAIKRKCEERPRPIWSWKTGRRADIKSLIEQMLPYLVVKREKALEILGELD